MGKRRLLFEATSGPNIMVDFTIIKLIINILFFLFSADILDRIAPRVSELGLTYKCVGGGRIRHESHNQSIFVYGYSVVSGCGLIV